MEIKSALSALETKYNIKFSSHNFRDCSVLSFACLGEWVDALDLIDEIQAIEPRFEYGKFNHFNLYR